MAGDVSDDLPTFRRTMELLTRAYAHVFFVPGNHDLWCRKAERDIRDSLGKLALLEGACAELGVHTQPACMGGVWVVPLLSWYHASWDREPDLPGATPIEKVTTVGFCACDQRVGLMMSSGRSCNGRPPLPQLLPPRLPCSPSPQPPLAPPPSSFPRS